MLEFLPGKHVLLFTTSKSISIINVVNVTLIGLSDHQSSIIHCVSEFNIIAMNVQNLTISKLSFSGCGAPIPEEEVSGIDSSSLPRSAMLFVSHVFNIKLVDTHVHDSKGAGMLVVNAFGLTLTQTSFLGNVPNCIFMFEDETNISVKLVSSYIVDSEFAYGLSESLDYAGGVSLIFMQTSYTININITNVALFNNTGVYCTNFLMSIDERSCKYTVVCAENVRSSNSLWHSDGPEFAVEEFSYNSVSTNKENHSLQFEYTVHVFNSYFHTSMGNIAVYIASPYHNLRVKFTDASIFCSNEYAQFVTNGLHIIDLHSMVLERVNFSYSTYSFIHVKDSEITIRDSFILENEAVWGVLSLLKSTVTFLGDIIFGRNYELRKSSPGAIYAHSSTLIFLGNVEFVNNTGYNGGAVALCHGSKIMMGEHAHLKFIGNHAKHFGGAIYVDNHVFSDAFTISCFYELADVFFSIKPRVVFENNSADNAGSVLYGGWIDLCEIVNPERQLIVQPDFDFLFQIKGGDSALDFSVIASNPLRVCLCIDSRPECSITQYNISVYPGSTIHIPMVAVGQRFGTVPTTVHSHIFNTLMNGIHPTIKEWQHTQKS